MQFTGLLSEALGVTPDDWGYQRVKEGERAPVPILPLPHPCPLLPGGKLPDHHRLHLATPAGYPPTIFIAMMKDGSTVEKIMEDKRILVDLRRPVAIIRVRLPPSESVVAAQRYLHCSLSVHTMEVLCELFVALRQVIC